MPTIYTNQGQSLAPLFMENAGADLNRVKNLILEAIERSSKLSEAPTAPFEHTINVDVPDPDGLIAFKLPLDIAINKAAVASQDPACLPAQQAPLEGLHFVEGGFIQPRLGLLVGHLVVGQLFWSRDGESFQLEIKVQRDARDMGAVLTLRSLKYNEHTQVQLAVHRHVPLSQP